LTLLETALTALSQYARDEKEKMMAANLGPPPCACSKQHDVIPPSVTAYRGAHPIAQLHLSSGEVVYAANIAIRMLAADVCGFIGDGEAEDGRSVIATTVVNRAGDMKWTLQPYYTAQGRTSKLLYWSGTEYPRTQPLLTEESENRVKKMMNERPMPMPPADVYSFPPNASYEQKRALLDTKVAQAVSENLGHHPMHNVLAMMLLAPMGSTYAEIYERSGVGVVLRK
jgi:hypothetical protein